MSLTVSILWFSSVALLFASLAQCVVLWAEKKFHHNRKFQIYFGILLACLTASNNIGTDYNQRLPIMSLSLISFFLIVMETVKAKSSITRFSIIVTTFVSITFAASLFANYKHAFFIISAVIYLMFIVSYRKSVV